MTLHPAGDANTLSAVDVRYCLVGAGSEAIQFTHYLTTGTSLSMAH